MIYLKHPLCLYALASSKSPSFSLWPFFFNIHLVCQYFFQIYVVADGDIDWALMPGKSTASNGIQFS
jgi:hypothetical protein